MTSNNTMENLSFLEIKVCPEINASIIWLHGLGADGYDFKPVVEALNLPNVRFILPHAPARPVSINNGYVMPAWYDIHGLGTASPQDEAGIRAAQKLIEKLIAQEQKRGVPARRIMLAGFSQGGALALHTALRYPDRLAGVIGLSTYLPLRSTVAAEAHEANRDIPVFMAHGTDDNVINPDTCLISVNTLRSLGYAVEWHEYPMAHNVCQEEIDDIREFITRSI